MNLTSKPLPLNSPTWCDHTSMFIQRDMLGWFIPGMEQPLTRTCGYVDADQETERITIWMTLGLDGSGDDLYKVHDGHWVAMAGTAAYVFEGHQDGMVDDPSIEIYQSFVAYGTREWPEEVCGDEDDLYKLVTTYQLSPESSCPWCGEGTGNEDTRAECALCDGDSYLAIGEYWQVAVYENVPPDEE